MFKNKSVEKKMSCHRILDIKNKISVLQYSNTYYTIINSATYTNKNLNNNRIKTNH